MGAIYRYLEHHVSSGTDGLFVEIGSDNGEGSTRYLDSLAQKYNTRLISVDVTDQARQQLGSQLAATDFVIDTGSNWADDFALAGGQISLLYLDNFDYIYDLMHIDDRIQSQIAHYRTRGVDMCNQACQIEHLKQLLLLMPCFSKDAVVALDDTYLWNDCWVGKSGPGVVYLLAEGWQVIERTLDCGVILKKV